jgi:hypothetical protein
LLLIVEVDLADDDRGDVHFVDAIACGRLDDLPP